jgi:hypothetical protein
MVGREAGKVSTDIDTETTWTVSYITFAHISFIPATCSYNSTLFTTFRGQAELGMNVNPQAAKRRDS